MVNISDVFGDSPFEIEKLHPDLRYSLQQTDFGLWIKHPLINTIFMGWKMTNEIYERKKESFDEAVASGDWNTALNIVERPWRLSYLMRWAEEGRVHGEELKNLLSWAWKDTEFPHQFGKQKLLRLFKAAGFVHDYDDQPPSPEGEVTIYRGVEYAAGIDWKKAALGISWTTDLDKAKWFAKRFGSRGRVYQGRIRADKILGMFKGRGESEVVVNPKDIIDLKQI